MAPELAAEAEAQKTDILVDSAKPVEETSEIVEPQAKRQKTDAAAPDTATSPDTAALRKQIEYYLSDENLKFDKFYHGKISGNDGWLEIAFVLSSKKMEAMKATKENLLNALKESKIEVREDGNAVRRPGNAVLPALCERQNQKKSSIHAHEGGIICCFKKVPEEISWQNLKDSMKEKLPPKANFWFVSEVNENRVCIVALAPFSDDVKAIESVQIEVGGAKLKPEMCNGDELKKALSMLPKHTRERREKEARKRQKERNRPILIGSQRFINVAALRTRMREVLQSRSDGEMLKRDGTDYKLVLALLQFHPRGAEKSKGVVDIKVAPSQQGSNRCFYMVREDGSEEDFSAKKCMDAVEANPPYVPKPDAAPAAEAKVAAAVEEKKSEVTTEASA